MKYTCNTCKYSSMRKSDFDKHLNSRKHLLLSTDSSNETVTEPKSIITNNNDNISLKKQIVNIEKKLEERDKQMDNLLKYLDTKDKMIENMVYSKEKDMDFIKVMASKAGVVAEKSINMAGAVTEKSLDVVKQSMSALTFLQTHYSNAPAITAPREWLPEFKKLNNIQISISDDDEYFDEEYHMIDLKQKRDKQIDTTCEDNFVRELTKKTEHLDEEIGNIIIAYIKKDDPLAQSLWCSDVSRLSYLIKEIVDNNPNVSTWKVDKKGQKVCNLLIKPLITEIQKISGECASRSCRKIYAGIGNTDQHLILNEEILNLLKILSSSKLINQIKKYVASALFLNKDEAIQDDSKEDIVVAE